MYLRRILVVIVLGVGLFGLGGGVGGFATAPAWRIDPEGLPGFPLALLYIGPDLLVPLTSALGATIGVVLMFWQRLVNLVSRVWRVLARRRSP
ncbi:MAG: hypothetical protein ABI920_11625 [Casimicrobiaceae bacterium]